MQKYFIGIILFILPYFIAGQSLFFNTYTKEDGLTDKRITKLLQGNHELLWVGTMNGLFRYEGKDFEEIYFADINTGKSVYDLLYDKNKVLWIAGKNGIYSFDGMNFKFYGMPEQIPGKNCHHLIDMGNKGMGFFYGKTFYQLFNDEIKKYAGFPGKLNQAIQDVYQVNSDTIWFLTSGGQLYLKTGENFNGPFEVSMPANRFFAIQGIGNRGLAIGSDRGIIHLKIKNHEIEEISWMTESDDTRAFFIDHEENIWFITGNDLVKINKTDTLKTGIPLKSGTNFRLYEDSEGNIWISVWNHGLYSICGSVISSLSAEKPDESYPTSFLFDNGKLWVSYFGSGTRSYDFKENTSEIQDGLASNYVSSIKKSGDSYWFATSSGITRRKGDEYFHYNTQNGLPHNYCYDIHVDSQGRAWVGTERGLGIITDNRVSVINTENGLSGNRIKVIEETGEGQLLLLSDKTIDLYENGKIRPFIEQPFNSKEELNTITKDQFGNFWLGSEMYGLLFYNSGNKELRYLSMGETLNFSRVRAIEKFGDDKLFLGTEKGLIMIKIDSDGELLTILPLGVERGYPDFEVIHNAAETIGDIIYFGTNIGTVQFYPGQLKIKSYSPGVNITGLNISFRETDWSDSRSELNSWFQIPQNPVLEHNKNDLSIDYQAVSLGNIDKIWYRYMLKGNDRGWSAPTTDNSAIYANLQPGKYTFLVEASYDGINWDNDIASYSIIIALPFWRTWWFIGIMTAFLLLGFIYFNNYRIKLKINQLIAMERLKKEEYKRIQKKVAMDFHDEVGNHLTSISLLVHLIKSGKWDVPDGLRNLLERIEKESNNLFSGTKDFIWSIDPGNDNLQALFYNIKEYGLELFENSAIQFHPEKGQGIDKIKLPPGFARQIVLIFKEGLNNALLHAGCKHVYFTIHVNKNSFDIKLIDDGKGFNADELKYYEGIKKMRYRCAKIRSELNLISNENQGTEINLIANY